MRSSQPAPIPAGIALYSIPFICPLVSCERSHVPHLHRVEHRAGKPVAPKAGIGRLTTSRVVRRCALYLGLQERDVQLQAFTEEKRDRIMKYFDDRISCVSAVDPVQHIVAACLSS